MKDDNQYNTEVYNMGSSVVIKGTKNGITLVLDENEEYSALKEKVEKKFRDSAKFLGNAKTALAFEGKKLTDEQKDELIKCIGENTALDIVCILDNSEEANEKFERAVSKKINEMTSGNARIYKGNLRSGQSIESDTGIVVLGDVNAGADLVSKGNIIVLGTLRGTAWAGAGGNSDCFVICSDMSPVQLRIADIIARSPDHQDRNGQKETKIAYLENNQICISPLVKEIITSLTI